MKTTFLEGKVAHKLDRFTTIMTSETCAIDMEKANITIIDNETQKKVLELFNVDVGIAHIIAYQLMLCDQPNVKKEDIIRTITSNNKKLDIVKAH